MQPRGEPAKRSVYETVQDLDAMQGEPEDRSPPFWVAPAVLQTMADAGALAHMVHLPPELRFHLMSSWLGVLVTMARGLAALPGTGEGLRSTGCCLLECNKDASVAAVR